MLAVHGYYDGHSIQTLEEVKAKPNQRVIITFMDDDFESAPSHKKSLRGILSEYADPALVEKENSAWEREMVEKYAHT